MACLQKYISYSRMPLKRIRGGHPRCNDRFRSLNWQDSTLTHDAGEKVYPTIHIFGERCFFFILYDSLDLESFFKSQ